MCHPEIASAIFSAAQHYHLELRWHIHLLLLMPDHLHALASFPNTESMTQVIRSSKHYLSKHQRNQWQRDYFDHRIPDHHSLQEKGAYSRQNPVRVGLINDANQWSFVWTPEP